MLPLIAYQVFSKSPEERAIAAYVPTSHTILDKYEADLNQDGMQDIILVLARKDENEDGRTDEDTRRTLIILMKTREAYAKLVDSDRIVYCKWCGGMMGDPYLGITIKPPYFTVEHYGGAADRWRQYITFRYVKDRRNFLLHKLATDSFNAFDPDKGELDMKTPKNFGILTIQDFDVYKK